MKRALLFVVLCLFAADTQSQTRRARIRSSATSSLQVTQLPIRKVILYSNGVAYIERRGTVRDHAEVSLLFKQSQVDDVLKSMVVLDLGKGRIGAVSYNSSAPPSARLAEIPFAIAASTEGNNGGLAGVLTQLQGARVLVTASGRSVTGAVLNVETQHSQVDSTKPPVTIKRLVIASDDGSLVSFDLAAVRSVKLIDEGSRRDLTEFAHAASSARRRDAKTIVVTSDGAGERELIVSYTIAAPIWKTTYRVLLDKSGKPFFQGWAIVDNISEEDWNGVELSLVSGTPVSFIQPIQNPVYRYRPVVPLQNDLNLRPQTYEPGEGGGTGSTGSLSGKITDPNGAAIGNASITVLNSSTNQSFEITANDSGEYSVQSLPPGTYTLNVSSAGFKNLTATNLNVRPGLRSKFNASLEVGNVSETVEVTAADKSSAIVDGVQSNLATLRPFARESLSSLISRRESGVAEDTTASAVGDLFEYHIDQPVTVPRDRSALIPILQTNMEGERVSIFNQTGPSHRPMSGLLLKNTSPLTLEDGSLTVIDGDAYVGEALLERLKPAEDRLVSFAVDLGTLVNVRDDEEERQATFLVRAINGVINAHHYNLRRKIYTVVNQTQHPRVLYIEHPRDQDDGWELAAETDKPQDTTAKQYRFRLTVAAHQKLEFPVTERQERYETYALVNFTREQLQLFIARKYIDDATRAKLENIIAIKDRLAFCDAAVALYENEALTIGKDQERLRENIKALTANGGTSIPETKQLIARYVSKANEQETRMEELVKLKKAKLDERNRLQSELAAAIRDLSLDRRL